MTLDFFQAQWRRKRIKLPHCGARGWLEAISANRRQK